MTSQLPGHPWIHRHGGVLYVEGVSTLELADRHGTPLYVYSRGAMLDAFGRYEHALSGREHLVCYAMKANSNLAVLQTLAAAGAGFDIVSGGELERVLAAGGSADRVVFSGVGKTAAEMARALEAGVMCFNVESEEELERLSTVATTHGRTANISLRVNPDVDAKTHPYISTGLKGNKFGIAHADALRAYRRAAELPGLQVMGIDCHIGSQITDASPYLEALDRLLDLIEATERAGIALPHLDLGGGLGIAYADEQPPEAGAFVASLLARIGARGHGQRKLLLEPGRSVVGNAGVLITEVQYLKPGEEKQFCIVDAAMNDLLRPAMYEAWMQIVECGPGEGRAPQRWDVVGPVCESSDWLGRDRDLAVRSGDRIAVLSAGAYGMSMASNYNTRPRAAEVMVAGDNAWLVRERESLSTLMSGERLLPR